LSAHAATVATYPKALTTDATQNSER